jgi:hypothetical protein
VRRDCLTHDPLAPEAPAQEPALAASKLGAPCTKRCCLRYHRPAPRDSELCLPPRFPLVINSSSPPPQPHTLPSSGSTATDAPQAARLDRAFTHHTLQCSICPLRRVPDTHGASLRDQHDLHEPLALSVPPAHGRSSVFAMDGASRCARYGLSSSAREGTLAPRNCTGRLPSTPSSRRRGDRWNRRCR